MIFINAIVRPFSFQWLAANRNYLKKDSEKLAVRSSASSAGPWYNPKDFGILSTGLFAGMKFDLIPEDPIFEYNLGNWGPMS